jgi:hypothetical protein
VNKHVRQREKQTAKAQKAAQRRAKQHMNSLPPTSQPIVSSGAEPADQVGTPMTVSSSEAGDVPITQPNP